MVSKIFFCSEFPDIPEKSWKRILRKSAKAKCFVFIANTTKADVKIEILVFGQNSTPCDRLIL